MPLFRTMLLLWIAVLIPSLAWAGEGDGPAVQEREACSPFTCSPADFAMEEPCRYIGQFHKESRQILEEMRAARIVTLDEWKCMARALQALDKEMTVKCKEKVEPIEVIEAWQIERYSPCLGESGEKAKILKCSLLSTEEECIFPDEVPDDLKKAAPPEEAA